MREYNCLSAKDFMHEVSRIMTLCENDERGSGCIKEKCESCPLSSEFIDIPICLGSGASLFKEFGSEDEFRIIVKKIQEWSDSHPEIQKLSDEEITILHGLRLMGYKYIAADGVNNVFAFTEKPKKICGCWKATYACNEAMISHKGHLRGKVHYLDKEPLEIEALLR